MPWFDDVADQVAAGSDKVKRSLEGVAQAAEAADKAMGKLSDTQKSSLEIADKFAKALDDSQKGLSVVGRAGLTAAKGLKAADAYSRNITTAMGGLATATASAAAGFRSVAADSSTFASSMGSTDKSIADVLKRVDELDAKLKSMGATNLGEVKDALEGVSEAAGDVAEAAGEAKEKLEKISIDKRVAEQLRDVKRELDSIEALGGLEVVDEDEIRKLLKSRSELEALSDELKTMSKEAKDAFDAQAGAIGLEAAMEELSKSSKKFGQAMQAAAKKAEKSFDKFKKKLPIKTILKKQTKVMRDEMAKMGDDLDAITDKKRYIELSVELKGADEFEDWVDSIVDSDIEKRVREVLETSKNLSEAIGTLSKEYPDLGEKMARAYKQGKSNAVELLDVTAKLDRQIGKQAKTIGDLVKRSFVEGKKQATEFADGLGKSATGMTAAGLAAYFMLQKIGELAKEFQQAAVDLSTFRVESAVFGKTITGVSADALEQMRSQLKLTREQASEFYGVLKEGINTLGLSQQSMLNMAMALQDTFGGDPTKRLREYVDLLKEIPTIDADLRVGADLDDQAATIFALAKRGKMDVAIELQAAGLAGGVGAEEMPGADILKAQQKTQYTTQKIGDFLVGTLYQSWSPYFSAAAEWASKTAAGIAAVVTAAGVVTMLMKQAATKDAVADVEAAVDSGTERVVAAIEKSGKSVEHPGRAPKGRIFKRVGGKMPPPGRVIQRTMLKYLGKDATKAVLKFAKPLTNAASEVKDWVGGLSKLTKGLAIASIAAMAVGAAAGWLEKKFIAAGNEAGAVAAGWTKIGADIAGFALFGAAVGSAVPVIGTAVGAVAGALVGLAVNLSDIGGLYTKTGKMLTATVKGFDGKPIQKYNKLLVWLGGAYTMVGNAITKFTKGVKSATSKAWDFTKKLMWVTSPIGMVVKAFKALGTAMQSDEYTAYQEELAQKSGEVEAAFGRLLDAESKWRPKLIEMQKKQMASGLALQRAMERVRQAAEDARLEMYDLRKEAAMVDLSGIGELGGSMVAYSSAVGDATDAVVGRYETLQKTLGAAAKDIETNEALMPEERRNALAQLHKAEMDAAKDFADSITAIIDALYKTPKLVEAGLKRETAKVELEVRGEAGVVSEEELFGNFREQIKQVDTITGEVAEASRKAAEVVAKEEEAAMAKRKKAQQALVDAYKRGDADMQKALAGAMEPPKAKGEDPRIRSEEELAKAASAAADEVRRLTKEHDRLKSMLPGTFSDPAKELSTLSDAMAKSKERVEQLQGEIEAAQIGKVWTSRVGEAEDIQKYQELMRKELEQQKQLEQDIVKKQAALVDAMREAVPDLDAQVDATALAGYLAEMAAKNGKLSTKQHEKWLQVLGKAGPVIDAITRKSYENAEATKKQYDEIEAQRRKAMEISEALNAATVAVDFSNKLAEELNKSAEEFAKAMQNERESLQQIVDTSIHNVVDAKIELQKQKTRLEVARKLGGASEAVAAVIDGEIDVTNKEIDLALKKKKQFQDLLKARKDAVAAAKKELEAAQAEAKQKEAAGDVEGAMAADAKVKSLKETVNRLDTAAGNANQALNKVEEQLQEISERVPLVGESVDKALSEIENTAEMAGARIRKDLGDTLSDLAPLSEDLAGNAEAAFQVTAEGLRKEAELRRRTLKSAFDSERKALEARRKLATTPEQLAQVEADEEVLAAKERAALGKVELDQKRGVVEAAKRSVQLRMDELDVVQTGVDAQISLAESLDRSATVMQPLLERQLKVEKDRLTLLKKQAAELRKATGDSLETRKAEAEIVRKEAEIRVKEYDNAKKVLELERNRVNAAQDMLQYEMDFLQEFGGSMGAIQDIQTQIVEMEREKVALARDALDAAIKNGASGQELAEAQFAVRKAEIDLQRKSLGAQKSIMDRMLGAAFGALSDIGGAKQVGTDVALMGVGGTRVRYPSGLMGGLEPGTGGTIEERAARAAMGTGKRETMFAAPGPKKSKTEEEMEKVRTATQDTADNTEGLKRRGSGYVSDETAQGLLASILAVMKEMAAAVISGSAFMAGSQAVKGAVDAATGAADKNAEDVKKVLDQKIAEAVKAVPAGADAGKVEAAGTAAEETSKGVFDMLALAKKDFRLALKEFYLAKAENRLTKKEIKAVETAYKKIEGLESSIRSQEFGMAGGSIAAGMEDYDRIMAGEVMPEMATFAKNVEEMGKAVKKDSKGVQTAAQKRLAAAKQELVEYRKAGGQGEMLAMKEEAVKKAEMDVVEEAATQKETAVKREQKVAKSASKMAGLAGGGKAIPLGSKPGIIPLGSKPGVKSMPTPALKKQSTAEKQSLALQKKTVKSMSDMAEEAPTTPAMSGAESAAIAAEQRALNIPSGKGGTEAIKPVGGAAAAAGAGAAGGVELALNGTINIRFDSQMFKMEVQRILPELVRGPEVLKALSSRGVVVQGI